MLLALFLIKYFLVFFSFSPHNKRDILEWKINFFFSQKLKKKEQKDKTKKKEILNNMFFFVSAFQINYSSILKVHHCPPTFAASNIVLYSSNLHTSEIVDPRNIKNKRHPLDTETCVYLCLWRRNCKRWSYFCLCFLAFVFNVPFIFDIFIAIRSCLNVYILAVLTDAMKTC